MILNRQRKSLYLLPWTMAVVLICVGSLINFHQHKIWHHPLVPQIVAHKKDVELTQTDIVLAQIHIDKEKHLEHFGGISALIISCLFTPEIPQGKAVHDLLPGQHERSSLAGSQGLRAPPMV
jgi:hypothetical protein